MRQSLLNMLMLGLAPLACAPLDVEVFGEERPFSEEPEPVILGLGGRAPVEGGGMGGQPLAMTFLVDDFEDGDEKAMDPAGWWYSVNDGTGVQELEVVDAAGVPLAPGTGLLLQISARDFAEWGAAWGIDIEHVEMPGLARELSFDLAADRIVEVDFHAIDGSGDHFTRTLVASPEGSRFVIRLDDLLIVDADGVRAFDVETGTELQWFVFDQEPITLWIDQVVLRSW